MKPIVTVAILIVLAASIAAAAFFALTLTPNQTSATSTPLKPTPNAQVQPVANRTLAPPAQPPTPHPALPPAPVNHLAATVRPQTEPLAPAQAAEKPDDTPTVVWKTVYEQHFDTQDCLKDFLQVDGGELQWHERLKALYLKNDDQGAGQIYAALHRSLPGDLRVRLRVLRTKHADEINIGILFNINGALKAEDGYFAEWKQGQVQIKRNDVFYAGGAAPTPATDDRWVNVELTKIGATITLYLHDKQVAQWTDPRAYRTPKHDLLSFYVWDDRTLIDDLIIERNEKDTVQLMHDDPAVKSNAVDGIRENNNPNPDQF